VTLQRTRRRLSRHFAVEEFDSRDGRRVPADLEGSLLHLCDWWLEPLRSEFGAVTILSGYRTHAHNLAVGGARRSVHLLQTPMPAPHGQWRPMAAAADVRCAEGSVGQWAAWAVRERSASHQLAGHGRGGIGTYRTFMHLDTGPWRRWTG
jgi:uncharacterized protein YcbK (DUF882 family)